MTPASKVDYLSFRKLDVFRDPVSRYASRHSTNARLNPGTYESCSIFAIMEGRVMSRVLTQSDGVDPGCSLSARSIANTAVPWVPLTDGKSFKPLRFLGGNRGFVELLRLEPGAAIPTHRHTGEVHAFNVQGSRQLCTGEIVGPGDYVYEPAGNVDSWKVIGDVPLVVLVVVNGAVEYLGQNNSVTSVYTADVLMEMYRRHCEANEIEVLELTDKL